MNFRIAYVFILFLITHSLFAQKAILDKDPDKIVYSSKIGLTPNLSDCTAKFHEVYISAKSKGQPIYIDQPGIYKFNSTVFIKDIDWDVDIIGCPGVIFQSTHQNAFSFVAPYTNVVNKLKYPIMKGDTMVKGVFFPEGSILAIEQNKSIGTIAYGAEILKFESGRFNKKFLFTTEHSDSLTRARKYSPACIHISNILFQSDSNFTIPSPYLLNLNGFSNVELKNVDFIGVSGQILDGANLYACTDVNITNNLSKNLRYPILLNLCGDVSIYNGRVYNCRHYTTISTWSRDILTDHVVADSGTRTPIESHYGWNVTYKNIKSHQTDQINLRAFGDIQLLNCSIDSDNSFNGGNPQTNYSLIGYHFAAAQLVGTKYEWLLNQTHILMDQVEYNELLEGKFRGLTATSFHNLTMNRCTTKCVGAYENRGDNPQILIDSSEFGHIYNRSGATHALVRNCAIDGNLSSQTWIHSLSQQDSITFINCDFKNCESKYLEENWQASGGAGHHGWNKYSHCQGTFLGLAKQATTGALRNHPYIFDSVQFRFLQEYPKTYANQSIPSIIEVKDAKLTWSDYIFNAPVDE